MSLSLNELPRQFEILGSIDRQVPNLSFNRDSLTGSEGRAVIVWRADFRQWFQSSSEHLNPRLYVQPSEQPNLQIGDDFMGAHNAVKIDGQHMTWRSFPIGRLLPLVGFALFAILLTEIGDSQPFAARALLVAQVIFLVLGIRAWIPRRQHPSR
jgi:hypothetical protein